MSITHHRRRSIIALIGSLVALTCFTSVGAAASAERGNHPDPKPTIVLVHGAFADASSWQPVADSLIKDGYPVIAPAVPLRDLAGDSSYVASVLATIEGPIVLVGHSYGGAVISNAALNNPNVKALVYVAGFALDAGESLASIGAQFPNSDLGTAVLPRPYPVPGQADGTDLYIRNDLFRQVFAADLPRSTAATMAATQRPLGLAAFLAPSGDPAWRQIPTWYLVASNDRAIDPAAERFMAERANAQTTEIRSSHAAMLSHPDVVLRMIRSAARATN